MQKQQAKTFSAWQIAATFIGTVVGAGFASGQEVLQFFGYFGVWGIGGLMLAVFLFYYFARAILDLGQDLQAESHTPIIYHVGGPVIGRVIDYVITFFLFGALTAMAAGAGAIFWEQFGWSPLLGNGLMLLVTLLTVLAGLSGVISAISFVVPILLVSVFGISAYTILYQGLEAGVLNALRVGTPAVPSWPLAAIVYVSYNLVMAVAILGPIGGVVTKRDTLKKGALWGALGLGLGAMGILLAILANLPQAAQWNIPMIYVSGQISPLVQRIYSVVLFAEVYTTAVGSLFGLVARLVSQRGRRINSKVAIGASLVAFAASQLGFTNLVRVLYPLVGYAGLLMLGGLLYSRFKRGHSLFPKAAYRSLPNLQDTTDKKEAITKKKGSDS